MVTKSRINTLCYDAKNRVLFSGNSEGGIMLWQVNTGTWHMYIELMYMYKCVHVQFIIWLFSL